MNTILGVYASPKALGLCAVYGQDTFKSDFTQRNAYQGDESWLQAALEVIEKWASSESVVRIVLVLPVPEKRATANYRALSQFTKTVKARLDKTAIQSVIFLSSQKQLASIEEGSVVQWRGSHKLYELPAYAGARTFQQQQEDSIK